MQNSIEPPQSSYGVDEHRNSGVSAPPPFHGAGASAAPSAPQSDDLVRVFNTALVTSRLDGSKAYVREMTDLVETPAFRAILNAVRQLARLQGISERAAAEQVIQTFRKVDALWAEYLVHEGLAHLKRQDQE